MFTKEWYLMKTDSLCVHICVCVYYMLALLRTNHKKNTEDTNVSHSSFCNDM